MVNDYHSDPLPGLCRICVTPPVVFSTPSHFCLLFLPVTYSDSVSAEEITQMEEWTCQLTCSSFITVCLWPLVRSGWVSSSNLRIRVRLHHDSEDDWGGCCGLRQSGQLCCFWHAVRHPACLPASLPPLTQPGVAGMLMSAVYEHCHWSLRSEMSLVPRADPC